ncbi:phage tail protein [Thermovibrio ammonificans]
MRELPDTLAQEIKETSSFPVLKILINGNDVTSLVIDFGQIQELYEEGTNEYSFSIARQTTVSIGDVVEIYQTFQGLSEQLLLFKGLVIELQETEAKIDITIADENIKLDIDILETVDETKYPNARDKGKVIPKGFGDFEVEAVCIETPATATLKETLTKDDTTITVDSTKGFADSGVLYIDNEQIYYEGKTSTEFLNCQRGYNNSTPDIHLYGATVSQGTNQKWKICDKPLDSIISVKADEQEITDYTADLTNAEITIGKIPFYAESPTQESFDFDVVGSSNTAIFPEMAIEPGLDAAVLTPATTIRKAFKASQLPAGGAGIDLSVEFPDYTPPVGTIAKTEIYLIYQVTAHSVSYDKETQPPPDTSVTVTIDGSTTNTHSGKGTWTQRGVYEGVFLNPADKKSISIRVDLGSNVTAAELKVLYAHRIVYVEIPDSRVLHLQRTAGFDTEGKVNRAWLAVEYWAELGEDGKFPTVQIDATNGNFSKTFYLKGISTSFPTTDTNIVDISHNHDTGFDFAHGHLMYIKTTSTQTQTATNVPFSLTATNQTLSQNISFPSLTLGSNDTVQSAKYTIGWSLSISSDTTESGSGSQSATIYDYDSSDLVGTHEWKKSTFMSADSTYLSNTFYQCAKAVFADTGHNITSATITVNFDFYNYDSNELCGATFTLNADGDNRFTYSGQVKSYTNKSVSWSSKSSSFYITVYGNFNKPSGNIGTYCNTALKINSISRVYNYEDPAGSSPDSVTCKINNTTVYSGAGTNLSNKVLEWTQDTYTTSIPVFISESGASSSWAKFSINSAQAVVTIKTEGIDETYTALQIDPATGGISDIEEKRILEKEEPNSTVTTVELFELPVLSFEDLVNLDVKITHLNDDPSAVLIQRCWLVVEYFPVSYRFPDSVKVRAYRSITKPDECINEILEKVGVSPVVLDSFSGIYVNGALTEQTTAREAIKEIAYETDHYLFGKKLVDKNKSTPVATITEDDIVAGSLTVSWTPFDSLYSEITGTFRNTSLTVNEPSQTLQRRKEIQFSLITDTSIVERILNRVKQPRRIVRFRTPLKWLALERGDVITLQTSLTSGNYLITKKSQDIWKNEIEFEAIETV